MQSFYVHWRAKNQFVPMAFWGMEISCKSAHRLQIELQNQGDTKRERQDTWTKDHNSTPKLTIIALVLIAFYKLHITVNYGIRFSTVVGFFFFSPGRLDTQKEELKCGWLDGQSTGIRSW